MMNSPSSHRYDFLLSDEYNLY